MRITTLKGEASLAELADRLFSITDAGARQRAEAALLKANPTLDRASGFLSGAVVVIPEVPDLKIRAAAGDQEPVEDVRRSLLEAVESYQAALRKRTDEAASDLDRQAELLKDREVAAAIRKDEVATNLSKELTASLRTRGKAIAEERKRQEEVFGQMTADLKALKVL